MNGSSKRFVGFALVLALGGLLLLTLANVSFGVGGGKGGAAAVPARYNVIHTEGHNLIVTDNQTNTVYFYTIDKDADIGADLKLRGSLDLNDVGKAVISPKRAK